MVTISTATAEPTAAGARVAVTGATGYIGRRLVPALLQSGHHVVGLVRDPARSRARFPRDVVLRQWSLDDPAPEQLRDIDVVCHLAAFIPPNMADPACAERCVADNAIGTQRLIGAMQSAQVRRLVHFSTGQLYRWKDVAVTEDDVVDPSRRAPYYLGSKLLAELFCRHAGEAGLLDVAILRIGSVYGPGMATGATIQRMIDDAAGGRTLRAVDAGRYGADFVFVDDVVRATVACTAAHASGVFNVGSGARTTMLDLATAIAARFGAPPPEVEAARNSIDMARGFPALDISRARRELGYIPTSLADGLQQMPPTAS